MPRNMSFQLTTQQILDETKFVTRRLGWRNLKPGELVNAVEKCQGLKKGEKVNHLKALCALGVRFEPLNVIDKDDCILEGFPHLEPAEFVEMFCQHNRCEPDTEITRIEFGYVKPSDSHWEVIRFRGFEISLEPWGNGFFNAHLYDWNHRWRGHDFGLIANYLTRAEAVTDALCTLKSILANPADYYNEKEETA